jgi:cytochrome c-type biogenesis protein CcsB
MKKWLPLLITAVMAGWFATTMFAPKDKTFAFSEFGKLPVVFNGRVQPMDSLARNSLLQIREKQEANLEPWKGHLDKPKMISATEWLATVMMDPATADQWRIFRVDNPEVISLLKLPSRDLAQHHDGKYYSWEEIQPQLHALGTETDRIADEKKESSQRNAYEKAAMKMRERLSLYVQLKNTLRPEDVDLKSEVATLESVYPAGAQSVSAFGVVINDYIKLREAKGGVGENSALAATQTAAADFIAATKTTRDGKPYTKENLETVFEEIEHLTSVINMGTPLLIPPHQAGLSHDAWKSMGVTLLSGLRDGQTEPSVQTYAAMASAFQAGDAPEFNRQLTAYRASLAPNFSGELNKARWEVFYNQMQPFYGAMVIYVLAGVLACLFWINLSETLRRSAVWLVVLALIIHTTGLVFRMALEGRPPVTNLYSSAIFIGWGACILGLILEGFWRNSIGVVVSSCVGFITLIIAHHLAIAGDTMEMMRAVLDTNFWLATHVVVVTLGYASTFVAGFLAIVYVIMGVFTPNLGRSARTNTNAKEEEKAINYREKAINYREQGTAEVGALVGVLAGHQVGAAVRIAMTTKKASDRVAAREATTKLSTSLPKMIYGIVCFATLFSFVGTVLGGIWADQSWGRFWGWDPKENGALIIVLWNALILHLRWGGMVRERGLATCAIIGNIVTSWSWFGVNMLGIGLHSYGFMDSAFWWLCFAVTSQLLLIANGLLPEGLWTSFGYAENAKNVSRRLIVYAINALAVITGLLWGVGLWLNSPILSKVGYFCMTFTACFLFAVIAIRLVQSTSVNSLSSKPGDTRAGSPAPVAS